jgi:transcriptional regulator with XRE-family HTH domain
LRARAGLKQREVADKIGRRQGVISKWERDESSPQVDDLRALSEFFAGLFPDVKVTAGALVGESDLILPRGPRTPPRKRQKKPTATRKRSDSDGPSRPTQAATN